MSATPEFSRYWQESELQGLEFLSARFVRHAYALHSHETFVIGVVEDGTASFWCGGQRHDSPAGTLMLINPGEPHTGQPSAAGGYRYSMIYPDPALFSVALRDDRAGRRVVFPQRVIRDRGVAAGIRALHRATQEADSSLAKESLLVSVLGQLARRHARFTSPSDDDATDARLLRARASLHDRLEDNVRLEELAREAGLSPFHFLRRFEARFGLPPHAYQRQARIERAKALLRRGASPVAAALASGFSDQSHLTRWFKRTLGVTPAQFARAWSNPVQDRGDSAVGDSRP
jgi:AraC-like DNA-binding protein